eukprot:CAMPEP_0197835662 /NCGR_PEP_ID=MMETSP1437-20131217/26567_1 /TAXON_ID=49252 ORGANISM="Eucampia antarctica, Strain CCMP1452" /NCGR_SAMPLE_ID=MMETSP1437 /ASSEMBLY_ACC=CAM_ASM_001096 /LENGTH=245 /DNA_ID=CAMNT_0043441275 /DNA_START=152 /DNA_END=889 /DNA_ORIENTATION=+
MSGRGRGRGRGYTPPTGAKLFLMRSAEECGLDSRNLRSLQDITKPALFPDMFLHSSGDQKRLIEEQKKMEEEKDGDDIIENKPIVGVKRSAATVFLISKGREIQHRMQNSVFYVRPTKDVPDVSRYSDSTRPPPLIDASAVLSNCLGGRTRTSAGRFIPEELVSGQRQGVFGLGGAVSEYADNNEGVDVVDKDKTKKPGEEENDEDGENLENEEEEEEEGEEDYAKNYYESEGDESKGDGGELTF